MAQNSFQELHSAKVDTAWGTNHSPNVSAQESLACLFSPSPLLPQGPWKLWAASGSVGTADVLVVSWAWNQLQTGSPSGRRWICMERPCLHRPQPPTL